MPGESHHPKASTALAIPVRRAHPGRTGARHHPKAGRPPRTLPAWWAGAPRPRAGRPLLGVLAAGTEAPHSKGAVAARRLRRVGPAGRPPAAVGPTPAGGGMPGVALQGGGGEESRRDTGRGRAQRRARGRATTADRRRPVAGQRQRRGPRRYMPGRRELPSRYRPMPGGRPVHWRGAGDGGGQQGCLGSRTARRQALPWRSL